MRRLLIISCSQRKRPDPGLLPAVDRYDGPAFRVLRRYLRGNPANPPDIHILSAEFGLIPADTPIPVYDRRMTTSRARELRDVTATAFRQLVTSAPYAKLHLALSKDYLAALAGWRDIVDASCHVTIGQQSPGRRLTVLRAWLYGDEPAAGIERGCV